MPCKIWLGYVCERVVVPIVRKDNASRRMRGASNPVIQRVARSSTRSGSTFVGSDPHANACVTVGSSACDCKCARAATSPVRRISA